MSVIALARRQLAQLLREGCLLRKPSTVDYQVGSRIVAGHDDPLGWSSQQKDLRQGGQFLLQKATLAWIHGGRATILPDDPTSEGLVPHRMHDAHTEDLRRSPLSWPSEATIQGLIELAL
ncbi:MAG TPA: hypothetical protein DCX12_05930 [Chloroflexi bacterium]|nr:hypothetical protein [Chloroflexota bacterium]